jgi:tetratricopeptide (TPR) repeat protein
MFQGVIQGYSNVLSGHFATGVLDYQAALSGTPLDHDGRVTLINIINANPKILDTVSKDGANAVLEYVVSLAEANVKENPNDSLMQMQLAQTLDTAAKFNYQDIDKFNDYSGRALQAMDRSIAASPGRAPLYLIRAQMLLFRSGDVDARESVIKEALKDTEYAISLNPQYSEPYCRLAQFYLVLKEDAKIGEPLNKCVDLGGVADMNATQLVERFVNYYIDKKDYKRIVILSERLSLLNAGNPQVWFNLAKIYWAIGESEKARAAASTAIGLDSKLDLEWKSFLDGVTGTTTK